MMKKWTTPALMFLISVSLFACSSIIDYKPKSEEESAINNVLVAFVTADAKGDVEMVASLLHENFQAPYGRDRTVLNKKEYLVVSGRTPMKLGPPQISISGNKAEARCTIHVALFTGHIVFNLVKENDKWMILGWEI